MAISFHAEVVDASKKDWGWLVGWSVDEDLSAERYLTLQRKDEFTPQDIRVVVGMNSTVTWVSRSLSFDSVVDKGGTFSSGAIGPGEIFSHSFAQPGVYDYYCAYHPWMVGTVTVISPGA